MRRLHQRFGIRAERVKVRTHVPWQWYAWGGLGGALFVALLVFGIMRWAGVGGTAASVSSLQSRVQELETEVSQLRSSAGTEENSLQITSTAQRALLEKLRNLERENAALKEEIAFYERIGVKGGGSGGLRFERVRVDPDLAVPGRYRYRLLLANQAASSNRVFKGNLQFNLSYTKDGQQGTQLLPLAKDAALPEYQLSVQNVESKEGFFDAPAGATLNGVEIRVVQDGVVKARQAMHF